jgi:hypothetical protein
MRAVFLSCHFGDADRELVRQVESLLESHSLRVITGEVLGGEALTQEIMTRIEKKADALVALMTKRETQDNNVGGTHSWVVDEFKHAKGQKKRAIAMVAPGVDVKGAYTEYERIDFDPAQPLKAFLKLSKTLGYWKAEAGRVIRAQVLPTELATKIAANGDCHCRFRLHAPDGTAGEWREAPSRPEGDGTYIYLNGVTDDALIQVRIEVGGAVWTSRVLAQWMPVELKQP